MPPTVNNVWGSNTPEGTTEFLTLPSGQTCQAVRIGMSGMVTAGILGDADSLTAYIDHKHVRRVRGANGRPDGEDIDVHSLMRDPESLSKVVMLVDRATPKIVVNPPVLLHFTDQPDGSTQSIPVEDRDPESVYTDQIPFEDKMFLFNWAVGGTRNAERFLGESRDAVAGVGDVQDVPRPAKRHSGGKRRR